MKTITSQAGGKEVKYQIHEYLNDIVVNVRVGGKHHTSGKPEVFNEVMQGRQIYGRIGSVYISRPDVWAEIWTAYTEAKDQLESSNEYKIKQLRSQREKLAYDLKYAIEELSETEQRKVESAMQGRAYRYDADKLESAIDDAKSALSIFDAAHPEIMAIVKKERDERIERNMWN